VHLCATCPATRKIGGVRTRFVTRVVSAPPKGAKHGLDLWKRAWKLHGKRALKLYDPSTAVGKVLAQLENEVIGWLGGEVSPMKLEMIRRNLVRKVLLDSIAAWMLGDPTRVLDAKQRTLRDVVLKWDQLARSEAETWERIGLDRPPLPALTLSDIIKESGGDAT